MVAINVVTLCVILAYFAKYGSASCPGPDGEVENGGRWVSEHFQLGCTSSGRRYKISPLGCASFDGTFIPWNQEIKEGSISYKCIKAGNKKSLRVRLSVGIQDMFFKAPKDETGPLSTTALLSRICYIPGVGKVSLGDDVQRGQLVLRCERNGLYQVTQCIIPTGERVPVDKSREIRNHRWSCKSVRGGASALISSIPITRSRNSVQPCALGAVKEQPGFRLRCISGKGDRPIWSATHCRLRKEKTLIPVGGSLQKGKITLRCSKLPNNRVRISIGQPPKPKSDTRTPLSSLKTPFKGTDGKPSLRANLCENPCKYKSGIICPGEDTFVTRNKAGDSRVRCTAESKLEQYCRIRALDSEDFYELRYGTFTEVGGRILACAQFGGQKEIQPGNTAPASPLWRARLQRYHYHFTPSDMLRK